MEKSTSLVTVLCSTYNSRKWIEGYLDALNAQLLSTFDVIFVDAASTDYSLGIIKDYEFREGITKKVIECDTRVEIYDAWNIAIKEANTPYVINVNTDDRLYPAGLSTYLLYAKDKPGIDVFYGTCNVVADEKHKTISGLYFWPEFSHAVLLEACICGPFPLLKRQSIVEAGLFNPKYHISGDYEMWLRMSKKGYKFSKVSETVGSYYYNPEGVSTDNDKKKREEHIKHDTELRRIYK